MSELSNASSALFAGYLTEEEVAAQRGRSTRTLRSERQRGDGPPWVRLGGLTRGKTLYPVEGFRAWLKSLERHPVRGPGAPKGA